MKKLIYLLTHNLTNSGIINKFNGQIGSLKKKFIVNKKYFKYKNDDSKIIKFVKVILFDILSIFSIFSNDIVYCRYSTDNALLISVLMLVSYIKSIFIEINTIDEFELSLAGRYFAKRLNLILIGCLKYSNVKCIVVTKEIGQYLCNKGVQENNVRYIQNGYSIETIESSSIDYEAVEKVAHFKSNFYKLAVFTGNDFPWNGIIDIVNLLQGKEKVGLIMIGKFQSDFSNNNILLLGQKNLYTIREIYKLCDFAVGSFGLHVKGLTEACPLKTREYLVNGLPILVNYYDCAQDDAYLRKYVFNINTNFKGLDDIIGFEYNKDELSELAKCQLSWDNFFNHVFDKN